ncbi:MAG: preprotein translocase subunit SecE [Micromonosporaceae bacterium]|nr:preprotein translocase subunit SecE [Micromonosporaceae bacterium]
MAESKRRGEDAVDERLDEELDQEALSDDAADDDDDVDSGADGAGDESADRPRRGTGGDRSTRTPVTRTKSGERPNPFARIRNFIREVISELGKVIWPTRKELLTYTAVVIVFVAIIMTIVGLLDAGFAWLVLHVFGTKSA